MPPLIGPRREARDRGPSSRRRDVLHARAFPLQRAGVDRSTPIALLARLLLRSAAVPLPHGSLSPTSSCDVAGTHAAPVVPGVRMRACWLFFSVRFVLGLHVPRACGSFEKYVALGQIVPCTVCQRHTSIRYIYGPRSVKSKIRFCCPSLSEQFQPARCHYCTTLALLTVKT